MSQPRVGIIMGSSSDLDRMKPAAEILEQLGVPHEMTIASAHRAPELVIEYASKAEERGLNVIVAGAGGAAHLPGVAAALTMLPVIGVPLRSVISIDGWDSVLSILQMPPGIPVATVALDGARNAGILAAQILATSDSEVREKLRTYRNGLRDKVKSDAAKLDGAGKIGFS